MEKERRKPSIFTSQVSGNKIYREWCKQGNRKLKIPQSVHGKILKEFAFALVDLMLFHNFEFRMPARLGYLYIRKYKVAPRLDKDGNFDKKSLPIDFGATNKLWAELYPGLTKKELKAIPNKKVVYFLNSHTNGYIMKIMWDKQVNRVRNSKPYLFRPVRAIKAYMAKIIKENPQLEFYERKVYLNSNYKKQE